MRKFKMLGEMLHLPDMKDNIDSDYDSDYSSDCSSELY